MTRPDAGSLQLAESRVRRFREDFQVPTAPVDCFWLIRRLERSDRIRIEWEQESSFSNAFDAAAFFFPSIPCYLIVSREPPNNWKQYSAWRRCNFTMAHELGHIFCGHLQVPESEKRAETRRLEDLEADAFAARLLMPEETIGLFRSVQEAAAALYVSESAIRRRIRETGISYEKRRCPGCGFAGIPPAARFCRKCGRKLLAGPNPEFPPGAAYVPPPAKACPACGQEAVAGEIECINCGFPRRNTCMPEYDQPRHYAPADALYCELCGAETEYKSAGLLPG